MALFFGYLWIHFGIWWYFLLVSKFKQLYMADKNKKQTTLAFFEKPKEDNDASRKRKIPKMNGKK